MKLSVIFVSLGAILGATISSATVVPELARSHSVSNAPDSACLPVAHVVIDSSTVEIYDASIHGTDPHLRLFNMIPLACPERHIRSLPRSPSSRTDLQLRSTDTSLSTIVFRRGFFSWAKSLLKWVPYASTAIGLFGLGECIWEWVTAGVTISGATSCVLGGITTLYGIGGIYQANVAASLASANINANFELVDVTRTWAQAGTQTEIVRRSRNPKFAEEYHAMLKNWTLPGARHHASGEAVTLWDLAQANHTHPLTVHHAHRAFKANHSHAVNVWSSMHNFESGSPRLHFAVPIPHAPTDDDDASTASMAASNIDKLLPRATTSKNANAGTTQLHATRVSTLQEALPTGCATIGEARECVHPGGSVPSKAPASMYYGFDLYGTKADIEEYQADLGDKFDKENGFEPALVDMAKDIVKRQAWDTCVCEQVKGNFISTGSIQMSWDNTYNGFSPCWKENCDNDAMVPVVN
ncbi:hypothetical protein R3P38DRAFT_2808025 [Favolaschia claudopus]|uniref:Uncharacterized protein n=1 Tax=Favolaschia claudopus TaxID=2862362 RepID=A0AAV9ZH52_9AGAR